MKEGSSYIKLNVAAMTFFMDDGTIDMGELEGLLALALQDGVIDDDEKRVLGRIFGQVEPCDLSAEVLARIMEIKKKHGIQSIESKP